MGILKKLSTFFMSDEKVVPARNLGRNDACWCGSGRKYKKCHLHADQEMLAKGRSSNCGTT